MPLPADAPTVAALDLFVSTVRLGSLSRAAAAHGITQPSASSRVRQLERQLKVVLLTRSPNGSVPTAAGGLVAEWAQRVLDEFHDLLSATTTLRSADTSIRVAASYTVAEHLLPRWLGQLRRSHPGTTVELEVVNSATAIDRVRSGEVHVGFVENPGPAAGLHVQIVGHDELVLVVAPGHPWASRRRPLGAARLAGTALVCREVGSGTRDALVAALGAIGLELARPALELTSTSAVRAAVESGAGPAVLSRLAVADPVAAGRLVEVAVAGLDLGRTLRAVWSSERLDPSIRALLEHQP